MDDPVRIVEEYLRLHMIPDPDAARQYCAPGMEIRFTGNRLMHDPAEATAFNRSRYKRVKKKFGPTARPSKATAMWTATSCGAARS